MAGNGCEGSLPSKPALIIVAGTASARESGIEPPNFVFVPSFWQESDPINSTANQLGMS
jgi:hypothetical protein